MTKDEFIGAYLDKEMKNDKLPFGMEWYNKLLKLMDKAEKEWEKRIENKLKTLKQ